VTLPITELLIIQILQFAMHYSWSTEARARRALANVSALLRPGGIFIGTMPDANVIIKKLREGIVILIGLLQLHADKVCSFPVKLRNDAVMFTLNFC